MIFRKPNQVIRSSTQAAPGLVGTLAFRFIDTDEPVATGVRQTTGIVESSPGFYVATRAAPEDYGTYAREWWDGQQAWFDFEELTVNPTGTEPATGPPGGRLATRTQLERYLKTAGTVKAGATVDSDLLDSLLAAASRRVEEARPERMLAIYPPLDDDGIDSADPVHVELAVSRAGQRVFQVPDLRELARVAVRPAGADVDEDGYSDADRVIPSSAYSLRRRPRELCALWINFTSSPSYVAGDELVLTGRFGPAGARVGQPLAVREDVEEAVLVWASRAYHNRTARYADNVQDPSGGVLGYFRNLPPDVKQVIDSLEVPSL